jgi:predicted metallo-beta-lactamase superfamily hydrolase
MNCIGGGNVIAEVSAVRNTGEVVVVSHHLRDHWHRLFNILKAFPGVIRTAGLERVME